MLDAISRASVDGAILTGIAWCICRAVPRLSPAARATLWWCVAARFVVGLIAAPVMLPVLPASSPSTPDFPPASSQAPVVSPASRGLAVDRPESPVGRWRLGAALLWSAGVSLSLLLAMRRRMRIRQLIARAAAADQAVATSARDIASLLALRRAPDVRLSPEVESPLVSGLVRPVILLPARFPGMPPDQQRMALCHEMAHVKRGDVLLGCVPAIAERLFFFHPLVRLAAREYAFWREAACDAAVIQALDTAPQSYGRLLLDLGVTGRAATLSPAGAAWSFSNLKRRIIMLRHPSTPSRGTRVLTAGALAAAFAGIVPLQLTARPVSPAEPAPAAARVSPAPVAEAGPAREPQAIRVDRDLRYVFFVDDEQTTMSGRSGDIERARRHRRAGEPMLWFIIGGDEYIVRDAGLLANLQSIWSEVARIGADQGEIGAKQGAIGARQGTDRHR